MGSFTMYICVSEDWQGGGVYLHVVQGWLKEAGLRDKIYFFCLFFFYFFLEITFFKKRKERKAVEKVRRQTVQKKKKLNKKTKMKSN